MDKGLLKTLLIASGIVTGYVLLIRELNKDFDLQTRQETSQSPSSLEAKAEAASTFSSIKGIPVPGSVASSIYKNTTFGDYNGSVSAVLELSSGDYVLCSGVSDSNVNLTRATSLLGGATYTFGSQGSEVELTGRYEGKTFLIETVKAFGNEARLELSDKVGGN